MTITPVLWRTQFQVNTTDSGTGGNDQQRPTILHLDNGNILVAWESNTDLGAGSPAGFDIIGRIFNPGGDPITDEFRLNRNFNADDERDPGLVSLRGDGFAVVYVDDDGNADLRVDEWSIDGVWEQARTLDSGSSEDYSDLRVLRDLGGTQNHQNRDDIVAAFALTPFNGGTGQSSETARGFQYDPSSNGFPVTDYGLPAGAGTPFFDDYDVDVLRTSSTQNAIWALSENNEVYFMVFNPQTGSTTQASLAEGFVFTSNTRVIEAVDVESLPRLVDAQQNFEATATWVVAFETLDPITGDSNVEFRAYATQSTPQGAQITPASNFTLPNTIGSGDVGAPLLVDLNDGGFVVFWIDFGNEAIRGQRYEATPNTPSSPPTISAVGSNFTVANYSGQTPQNLDGIALSDDRIAIVWDRESNGDHDVFMEIWDPRTAVPNETTGDDYIVSDVGGGNIRGDLGDDLLVGSLVQDELTGAGGADTLYGLNGNDDFTYAAPSDLVSGERIDGGSGTDEIVLFGGGSFDFRLADIASIEALQFFELIGANQTLQLGSDQLGADGVSETAVVTFGNDISTETLEVIVQTAAPDVDLSNLGIADFDVGIDAINIVGSLLSDDITGTRVGDSITGSFGNDSIIGGLGADTILAGNDNDTILASIDELEAGEIIQGGLNTDTLVLIGGGDFDLSTVTLGGLEVLEFFNFGNADASAALDASQFGAGLSLSGTVDGNSTGGVRNFVEVTLFNTSSLDLSGLNLIDWGPDGDEFFIVGDASSEDVTGTSGNDTFDLGGGQNVANGGGGNDVFRGANSDDAFNGGPGDDFIDVAGGATNGATGGTGNDTIKSASGISGANVFDGGDNVDLLDLSASPAVGGSYNLTNGNAVSLSNPGIVDIINNFENFIGTANADEIIGTSDANSLEGGAGNDTIFGGQGADSIDGGANDDTLLMSNSTSGFVNPGNNNTLLGGVGDDTLGYAIDGLGQSDVGSGQVFDGGDNRDTFAFETFASGYSVDLIAGTFTLLGNAFSFATLLSIEDVSAGLGSDSITGTAEDNELVGNDGNDVLRGFGGDDDLRGGDDNDTLDGGAGRDDFDGGAGNDLLIFNNGDGLSGSETFEGGGGTDTILLNGGSGSLGQSLAIHSISSIEGLIFGQIAAGGDRTLFVNASQFGDGFAPDLSVTGLSQAGSREVLAVSMGIADTLDLSALSFAAWSDQNELVRIGGDSEDERITGTSQNDEITGAAGNDTIAGGAGADLLNGGDDRDRVSFEAETGTNGVSVVLEDERATDTFRDQDTITGFEDVIGSQNGDAISGTGDANQLIGLSGNDQIFGLAGADDINGGQGSDTLNGANGNDTILGGSEADIIRGQGQDDVLAGGSGTDDIFGGAGADSIQGGSDVDNILGQGQNDTIAGDEGDDTIGGGSGNDSIMGGENDDDLIGNGNNDTLIGDDGADSLLGGSGLDVLFGGAGNDTLKGGDGADRLDGGTGDDVLNGGGVTDTARDIFVFALGYEADRINGFDQAGPDRIELDQDLWLATNPTLNAQQVVDTFGVLNGTGTILTLDFGGGDVLEVQNGAGIDQATLGADIVFI